MYKHIHMSFIGILYNIYQVLNMELTKNCESLKS